MCTSSVTTPFWAFLNISDRAVLSEETRERLILRAFASQQGSLHVPYSGNDYMPIKTQFCAALHACIFINTRLALHHTCLQIMRAAVCSVPRENETVSLQVAALMHESSATKPWLSQIARQLASGEPAVQAALSQYLQCADSSSR